MAAIAEIMIDRPVKFVWDVIADNATHPLWLGEDGTTEIEDGLLLEGKKFRRVDNRTGKSVEGEIVSVREPFLLKVRADLSADCFGYTEYHLVAVDTRCVVRVIVEIYDTGDAHHAFYQEVAEREWEQNLRRLKDYCEKDLSTR